MPFRTLQIERLDRSNGRRTVKTVTDERPRDDATLSVVARSNCVSPMIVFDRLARGQTLSTPGAVYRRVP